MRNLWLILLFGFFAVSICAIAVGSVYDVPTRAMEPTLHQGDRLAEVPVFGTLGVHRGSLVAFRLPYDQGLKGLSRVVGLPGDHIQVKGGRLVVDGKPVYEPYLPRTSAGLAVDFPSNPDTLIDNSEIRRLQSIMYGEFVFNDALTVPEGYYFILDDNRAGSVDSRIYGPIPQNAVFALPVFVYSAQSANSRPRYVSSANLEVKR